MNALKPVWSEAYPDITWVTLVDDFDVFHVRGERDGREAQRAIAMRDLMPSLATTNAAVGDALAAVLAEIAEELQPTLIDWAAVGS